MVAPRVVMVFARVPRLGAVKTRLAARVGDEEALRVHRALLEQALSVAGGVASAQGELWIADEDTEGECMSLASRYGLCLRRQRDGDLGERMHDALSGALGRGHLPVLIGCDCPVLSGRDIVDAFEALGQVDAVFAPTEDGGYALVGVARPMPEAFSGLDWGGSRVMEDTRRILRARAARWRELRTLWDLDDGDDYLRWRASGAGDRGDERAPQASSG